jgi:hypothetical protein
LGGKWEVSNFEATYVDSRIRLNWTDPSVDGLDHIEIRYGIGSAPVQTLEIPRGTGYAFVPVANTGETFSALIRTFDVLGNTSAGVLTSVKLDKIVDDLVLDPYITPPVAGAVPNSQPIDAPQYTGTVRWRVDSGYGAVTIFEAAKGYTLVLFLTPREGYTFQGLGSNQFKYAGTRTTVTNIVNGTTVYINFLVGSVMEGWYVDSYATDDTGNGKSSTTALQTVGKALDLIKTAYDAVSPAWYEKENADERGAVIVVSGTIDLTNPISIGSGYPAIELRGANPSSPGTLKANGSSRVLEITGGARVTLGHNLTLTNGGDATEGGGGVSVTGNNSSFTMNGGAISGNKTTGAAPGGGLYVGPQATFTMKGGDIAGNTSAAEAGGVYILGSTATEPAAFTMSGGFIRDNTALTSGGIRVKNTTFTLNGGNVSFNQAGNEGGGIALDSGSTFVMNTGKIEHNILQNTGAGGGIWATGPLTLNGGEIVENDAGSGGGLWTNNALTINGGTIARNKALGSVGRGAGVYVTGAAFLMRGGIITGNTAEQYGGGLYLGPEASFKKEPSGGGVMYGYDPAEIYGYSNKVEDSQPNHGHAIYGEDGPLHRETDAGTDALIDTTLSGPSGGWE